MTKSAVVLYDAFIEYSLLNLSSYNLQFFSSNNLKGEIEDDVLLLYIF